MFPGPFYWSRLSCRLHDFPWSLFRTLLKAACGVSDHWESTRMYYPGIQIVCRVLIINTHAGNWQELIHEGAAQMLTGLVYKTGFFFSLFSKISLICLHYLNWYNTKNLTRVNSTRNGKTLSCSENALKKFPKVSFFLIAGMQLYQYDKLGRLMSVHWWEGWTEDMTPAPIMINRSSYSANTILLQPPSSCLCLWKQKHTYKDFSFNCGPTFSCILIKRLLL